MEPENAHAGQGAVVVDIGDGVGALIVVMPEALLGVEVEIVPTGTAGRHDHTHGHSHAGHDHSHDHHDEGHAHPPHVAVVNRPLPDGRMVPTLVFGELAEGEYDLYVRPDGAVELTVKVEGGAVTEARWPSA